MKNCAPTTKAVITTKTSDSEVLIFCIEFWELSHLTGDLSQAEREKMLLQAEQMHTLAESPWDIPYLNMKIFLFRYQIFKSEFYLSLTFPILLSDYSSMVKSDNEIGKK